MKILLLGATGSIGNSACRCVRRSPDVFQLVGLSANRNADALCALGREFNVRDLCIADAGTAAGVNPLSGVRLHAGADGLMTLVNELDYDILLNALIGFAGLAPTVAALTRGKRVALANKESLVTGGDYLRGLLKNGGELIPVDSEHSAILQCITGEHHEAIESIILTASGGPFREMPAAQFASITPAQALNHPVWSMGSKITIDSATLMNKGFELIEAHHLFKLDYGHLRVWIHPQSIIHSMVEFHDGAIIAQLGLPDMELPIQYALSFPSRLSMPGKRLNLAEVGSLTFHEPDFNRFPCLRLCIESGKAGGSAPITLNAVNEIAVELFLRGEIGFNAIPALIDDTLSAQQPKSPESLEEIIGIDTEARIYARERAGKYHQ